MNECNYELRCEAEEFVTPIVYDIHATSLCECAERALHDLRGEVVAGTDVDGVPSNGDRPLQGWVVTIEDMNGKYLTRYTNERGEYRLAGCL